VTSRIGTYLLVVGQLESNATSHSCFRHYCYDSACEAECLQDCSPVLQ